MVVLLMRGEGESTDSGIRGGGGGGGRNGGGGVKGARCVGLLRDGSAQLEDIITAKLQDREQEGGGMPGMWPKKCHF